jgi:hypothetical protein
MHLREFRKMENFSSYMRKKIKFILFDFTEVLRDETHHTIITNYMK